MATTLLRRYFVKPDRWEDFLAVWQKIARVRQRFGFAIHFACADRERNVFTWAISIDGDLDDVNSRYYADPERVGLSHVTDYLDSWEITRVEPVGIATTQ